MNILKSSFLGLFIVQFGCSLSLGQSKSKTYKNQTRFYELANNHGDIEETILDKPIFSIDLITTSISSYSDYCPYGMKMVGRNESVSSYRYGFQGQEQDGELRGNGNSLNYRFRMHDPRVGRFFSVDPLASKYPWYSSYQFSGNRLIDATELEGLEPILDGTKKEQKEFLGWVNEASEGIEFELDDNGKMSVVGGEENVDEENINEFGKEMLKAARAKQEITYFLKGEKGEEVAPFDSFKSGSVFMADLRKLDDNLKAAIIGQFTAERFGVTDYETNRESITQDQTKMDEAWAVGGKAHERILNNITSTDITKYMSSVNKTPDGMLFIMMYEYGDDKVAKVQFYIELAEGVDDPWGDTPVFEEIKKGEIKTPEFE